MGSLALANRNSLEYFIFELPGSKRVIGNKIDGKYFATFSGEEITGSIYSLSQVTLEQGLFELAYRKVHPRPRLEKADSLMYLDMNTTASYQAWRIAKGLPIGDPDYISVWQEVPKSNTTPEYYRRNRGHYVGD